ncbi:MAG TPA: hypothetical protein VM261_31855 [Kofleriaceae bacterium]|nr:hypothetical protein [Kofleriaceae bacterium]
MNRLALFTFTLITATSTAATGVAHADEKEERKQALLQKLGSYDNAVKEVVANEGLDGAGRLSEDPAGCTDAIDQLKDLGVGPTEVVYGGEQFPLRKAPEKCARYAKLKTLSVAFDAITEARQVHNIIGTMKPGDDGTTLWSGKATTLGKACVDAINAAEAKGAIMDVVLRSPDPQMTAAQTRTWCEGLIERGAALQGASADADTAKKKAAHDRYAKFGAGGERLSLLTYYDPDGTGFNWRVGGCKVTDDPKTLAKTKVLFQWWENDDGTHRIRKYSFKGNKKVGDQERSFLTEAKARTFCK